MEKRSAKRKLDTSEYDSFCVTEFSLKDNIKDEGSSCCESSLDILNKTLVPVTSPLKTNSNDSGLSAYEQMRRKNLERKQILLQELGILEAKENLVQTLTKKPKKRKFTEVIIEPRAKSLRLKGLDPNGIKLSEVIKPSSKHLEEIYRTKSRKDSDPISMISFDDDGENCSGYLEELKEQLEIKNSNSVICNTNFASLTRNIKSLKLNANKVKKIVPNTIYSLAVHPSESKILVAVGDKRGSVGIWDVNNTSKHSSLLFEPHSGCIRCTTFCQYNSTKIYTTSLDGTVRCGDLEKRLFYEIYASDPIEYFNHTTWHTQMDEHVLLISHGTGKIALIDTRVNTYPSGWYWCYERSARSVQRHPHEKQYFLTSSKNGLVCVWDIRKMEKNKLSEPVLNMPHDKSISGAFFSSSGKRILTTCNDNTIRAFQADESKQEKIEEIMRLSHNNYTGRWLAPFQANWHPQNEDMFIVGSLENIRQIPIIGVNGQIIHKIKDENLTTICSRCIFHPTLNMVFGGNSSGKIFAFM